MHNHELKQLNRTSAVQDLSESLGLYRLWLFMAYQDIVSRYRRSIFGPIWVAAMMITQSAVMALVFGSIYGISLRDFLPYVVAGMSVMLFLGSAFNEGPETFIIYRALIQASPLPLSFHVFRMCTKHLIVLGHNLAVFLALYVFLNGRSDLRITVLPAVLICFIFLFAVTLFNAVLSLRFRDYRFLLPHLWTLVFFLTPVIYKPSQIADKLSSLNSLNPAYYLLAVVRSGLDGHVASSQEWFGAAVSALVALVVALLAFSSARKHIALWV